MNLFHAYVVEGNKDDAKKYIDSLLKENGLFPTKNIDSIIAEYVNFSIDDARVLKEWQMLSATTSFGKAYIALTDFINIEAQNALLKTFEEPTNDTYLFFSIENASTLLPTFLSRVQVIKINEKNNKASRAKEFLKMGIADRILFVDKLAEKGDEEDASARSRKEAISFLNEIEDMLSEDLQKNIKILQKIFEAKKYLLMSGASTKMILETIALNLKHES